MDTTLDLEKAKKLVHQAEAVHEQQVVVKTESNPLPVNAIREKITEGRSQNSWLLKSMLQNLRTTAATIVQTCFED